MNTDDNNRIPQVAQISKSNTALAASALFGRAVIAVPEIICATTDEIFQKTPLKSGAHAYRWGNRRFDSVTQLAEERLRRGFPICTGALADGKTHRNAANIGLIYIVGTDHDDLSVEQLLKNRFVASYAAIVYETASSTPEAPRSRALYILDAPITPAQFRLFIRKLLAYFGQDADPRCSDPARIWYGSTNPKYLVREGVYLPVSVLAALPDPPTGNSERAALEDADSTTPLRVVSDAELDAIIMQRLGVTGFNGEWSNPVLCPFHDDHNPSAAWNIEGYLHCFRCETSAPGWAAGFFGRKHVARHFGLTLPTSATTDPSTTSPLPNEVFERLNQVKLGNVARVWEGLTLAGYQPGQTFTATEAIRDLPNIGRDTVRKALNACIKADPDGTPYEEDRFIYCFLHTSPTPQIQGHDYYVVRVQKPVNKSPRRGRPAGTGKTYVMPSVEQLCIWLGITTTTPGDRVEPEAMASGKTYRIAKHAAFIQRRNRQQAGINLLRRRLGVSRRTVHTYNQAAGIEAIPVYRRTPITRENIGALPFADAADVQTTKSGKRFVPNSFIEDVTDVDDATTTLGKRYPPLAGAAAQLLKDNRTIYLCEQQYNAWEYQPQQKTSAPIFKYRRVEMTPQALPKAAGAEGLTPDAGAHPIHGDSRLTDDDTGGYSNLNPYTGNPNKRTRK